MELFGGTLEAMIADGTGNPDRVPFVLQVATTHAKTDVADLPEKKLEKIWSSTNETSKYLELHAIYTIADWT
jgi:hypothetical protein